MNRKVSDITKGLIQLEEKRKIINGLRSELLECVRQATLIASKGSSKYPKVTMKRIFRVVGWAMKAKSIMHQIDMVKAQPIFPQGGLPIVGEEIIIKGTNHG